MLSLPYPIGSSNGCDGRRPTTKVHPRGNCRKRAIRATAAIMRRIVSKPTTKQITIVPTAKPPSSKRELHVALADHGLQQCVPRPRAQPRTRTRANRPPCR